MVSVGSPAIAGWRGADTGARDWDDAQLRVRTHIWRVETDGTGARQLTFGDANTTTHVAARRHAHRVPVVAPTGAAPAPAPAAGAGEGPWQPDLPHVHGRRRSMGTDETRGRRLQFQHRARRQVDPLEDPLTADDRRRQRERDDAVVVDETFRWTHLWIADLESGKARRVTQGQFVVSDPQWSPDSKAIAYVQRPNTKVDDSATSDVWVTDVDGKTRKLFENAGPDTSRAGCGTAGRSPSRRSRSRATRVGRQAAPLPPPPACTARCCRTSTSTSATTHSGRRTARWSSSGPPARARGRTSSRRRRRDRRADRRPVPMSAASPAASSSRVTDSMRVFSRNAGNVSRDSSTPSVAAVQALEPPVADDPPHHRAVLLFDKGLVVLPVGAAPRELHARGSAVVPYGFVHERAVVVRVGTRAGRTAAPSGPRPAPPSPAPCSRHQ